jgi:hypothetical protein
LAKQDNLLLELQEIHQKVIKDREAKKRFWRIVGSIKRESSPNPELVEIAGEIRDTLYLHI